MANARIGALRVDLGMNTAVFERGVSMAQRKINRFASNLQKTGKQMQGIGKSLSVGLTAPIVGVGAAFGKLTHDLARNAKEMKTAADVAGESFEQFQRQAHAAKTVGIEFDKLGDIFKDVRDRVGDFAATGGGPMADFFENIAPKVGITQEAFKGLSGKDGLQLYYDSLVKAGASQEEIVFYMEAMASDATNLIPLLQDGGKAMKELGENASIVTDEDLKSLERYTKAQEKMGQAVRSLTIALVDSGLLDIITSLVTKVAEWTKSLSETNPTLLKVSVGVLAVVAAIGPLVATIGTLVSGFGLVISTMSPLLAVIGTASAAGGPILAMKVAFAGLGGIMAPLAAGLATVGKAMLGLLANPVVLGAAAVITGIYLAWKHWDKIVAIVETVKSAVVNFWNGHVRPIFSSIGAGLSTAASAWLNWKINIIKYVSQLVRDVKIWLVDKLNSVWTWINDKIATVKNSFFDLYDAVVGNSYVPDMVDEIGQHMKRLDQLMVSQAQGATSKTKQAFAEMARDVRGLLDNLFPTAAAFRQYQDNLSLIQRAKDAGASGGGLSPEMAAAAKKAETSRYFDERYGKIQITADAGKEIELEAGKLKDITADLADDTEIKTVRIAKTFADMAQNTISSLEGLANAIKGGGFFDILSSVVNLGLQLGGAGVFGSGVSNFLNTPSFAGGGFTGSGPRTGGTDGKGGFLATLHPNETVIDHTKGGQGMGGNTHVTVGIDPRNGNVTAYVDNRISSAAPTIVQASTRNANSQAARQQSRRVR